MIAVALRGLAGRKLRAILTSIAIILGVAMVSGTYILTDSIDKAFSTLFTNSYANTDAVISGQEAFETDFALPPPFDAGLLDEVRALPGTEVAAGSLFDSAQLTTKDGESINTQGAPSLAFGIDASEERFNPLELTAGRWPTGDGEVVIDKGVAEDEGYQLGDSIGVAARGPIEQFEIVGIASYGDVDSIGSATFAVFDIPTAQRLFEKQGELDAISIAAREGVSTEQLISEIEPILPSGTKVQSGDQESEDAQSDIEEFTSFIQYFLLAFGLIALFVGAFVIFNTLSITVAQRVREFATLRTVGASRRQVLGSVVLEAFVIGLIASIIGLFVGLGLAVGLKALLKALGLDLPQAGTVFAARTVIVSLLLGVIITLLAGVFPAIRATRVPPIAAVREGATLPRGRLSRFAPFFAVLVTIGSILLLVYGVFGSGLGIGERLGLLGVGCLLLFVGVALTSRYFIRPLASVLGWPARTIGGAAGRLASENSKRNPARTAATAAALMIGLALITFVGVLAQGLRDSVGEAVNEQVNADFVAIHEDGFTPFEPTADAALAAVPGTTVTGVRGEFGEVGDEEKQVTGVDPAVIAGVYEFDWVDGSDDVLASLDDFGAVVEEGFADDFDLRVGDFFSVLSPAGRSIAVEVAGIYEAPPFWRMLGDFSVSTAAFDEAFENPRNLYTFVTGDVTLEQLEQALESFPTVQVDTKDGFVEFQQDSIGPFLNLLYVLLALSVIVSLFGIVNTLVLSVFERTRELGMLRAVGMTRRQVRRMIRHESVITAMIGALLGIVLGLILAGLVTAALESEGLVFSVPVVSLIVFAVIAVLAGIAAAILPARRAARLNVLQALQYE